MAMATVNDIYLIVDKEEGEVALWAWEWEPEELGLPDSDDEDIEDPEAKPLPADYRIGVDGFPTYETLKSRN